jgi:hypothetical protein
MSVMEKPKVRASLELSYSPIQKERSSKSEEKIEPVISSIRRLLHNEGATEIKTWTLPDRKKSNEPDVIFEFIVPNETCLEHIESLLKKEYSIDNLYMFVSE